MESNIDTCPAGHKFAKLPDHPLKDGTPRCPHCMAQEIEEGTNKTNVFSDDFLERDINTLGLSERVVMCLKELFVPQEWKDRNPDYYKHNLCVTIRDLVTKNEEDLIHRFRCGKKSLHDVKQCLSKSGLSLGMKFPSKHNSV